jgi:hypothetical protein
MGCYDRHGKGRDGNRGGIDDLAGQSLFKTVVELAQNGASRMAIRDLPVNIRSLDVCTACIAENPVHLSQGRTWTGG